MVLFRHVKLIPHLDVSLQKKQKNTSANTEMFSDYVIFSLNDAAAHRLTDTGNIIHAAVVSTLQKVTTAREKECRKAAAAGISPSGTGFFFSRTTQYVNKT